MNTSIYFLLLKRNNHKGIKKTYESRNYMKSVFIICVAIFVWGALHSILATDKSKLLLGNISKTMSRFYRIFYNIFSIVSLFPIVYLVIWLADKPIYTITYPWILVSFLIQVAAAGLMIIGIRQSGLLIFLGIEFKSNMDLNSKEQMITDGLYRIVRHPLYSLGLLILWLNPVMTMNRLTLTIGLTIYIVIGAHFEEKRLEKKTLEMIMEYINCTLQCLSQVLP